MTYQAQLRQALAGEINSHLRQGTPLRRAVTKAKQARIRKLIRYHGVSITGGRLP